MKRIYLASQFYVSGLAISHKISDEQKQKTVFITTPIKYKNFTEAELDWHYKNRNTLKEGGFICEDYDIAGKSEADLVKDLASFQVMYVEGGDPFYFLKQTESNNFISYVIKRVEEGMIYVSESAGSVVAGIDIRANGRPGKNAAKYGLTNTSGIHFINAVFMPHWGLNNKRKDYQEHKFPQTYHEDYPYMFIPNNCYIEITGNSFKITSVS
ncbi:MAG: hypothetical protein DPW11_00410 [bacterium]|nr:hypothetical protein [Candidatus Microgenomates bacterium CPR3]MCQ3944230.1 hypothetical protein [bacterium]RIK51752.1 MAG: hypothetical protein DCC61_01590 [Candidatus Microgenomates bacterium]